MIFSIDTNPKPIGVAMTDEHLIEELKQRIQNLLLNIESLETSLAIEEIKSKTLDLALYQIEGYSITHEQAVETARKAREIK